MTRTIITLALLLCSAACVGQVEESPPAAGTFGAPCGFDSSGTTDRGQCGQGLECFGVCTFECGEKYSDSGDYGLDVQSVTRCASHLGSCEQFAPTVQINVCKQEAPARAR